MNYFRTGILVVLVALLLSAGCIQSPVSTPQPVAAVPTPGAPPATPLTAPTSVPQAVVTVIHYIQPAKVWKDAELHITFSAPQDWAVTTRQMNLPEGSQGLMFQTVLVPNDVFSIVTYPISMNQDQAYRDLFRTWDPAPVQTTVTYNGITFDRFESTRNGKTRVGYVAQKGSASDIGFSSVIVFTADEAHPFEKLDFETVVASFAYLTNDNAATMPGGEIPRLR